MYCLQDLSYKCPCFNSCVLLGWTTTIHHPRALLKCKTDKFQALEWSPTRIKGTGLYIPSFLSSWWVTLRHFEHCFLELPSETNPSAHLATCPPVHPYWLLPLSYLLTSLLVLPVTTSLISYLNCILCLWGLLRKLSFRGRLIPRGRVWLCGR